MSKQVGRLRVNKPAAAALLALCLSWPAVGALASEKSANPSLWGYSGLLQVPTADTYGGKSFYTGLRYFPLNSGLSGSAAISILDDLEASLVFGAPPANGFASLAASLKYRIMDQHKGQPLSLAVGASLLGLNDNTAGVPGNNVYLMLSRGLDWENQRLVNFHAGFMGAINGARLVGGLDVPIADILRLELEYLGNFNFQNPTLNFGVVVNPHPDFSVELGLLQSSNNFADRDISLGLAYRGDWGKWLPASQSNTQPNTQPSSSPSTLPSPQPTPVQSLQPPAREKGVLKVRALDKQRIIALQSVKVELKSPTTGLHFSAVTDISGEAQFDQVPVGTYEVHFERAGWHPEHRLISVQSNLDTFLEVALSGQDGTLFGKVETLDGSAPGDLTLELLDLAGKVIKRGQIEGNSYRLENISPGSYVLVVRQDSVERLRLNVLAKGNSESQYDLNLLPLPIALPSAAPTAAPTAAPESSASPQPSAAPTSPPSSTTVSAQIEGTLKDKSGNPLSGVRLELKNDDLLVITLSTPEGKYAFRDIPRGVYRLGLSKTGFKARAFQISINKTETLTHDFELEQE